MFENKVMNSCPKCKKQITLHVSGKYTCSCGEVIQLSNNNNKVISDLPQKTTLNDRISEITINVILIFCIVLGIALFAWDSDLPYLFDSYSDIIWDVISYVFIVAASMGFVFVALVMAKGISENGFVMKDICSMSILMIVMLAYILYFLNDVVLVKTDNPIIDLIAFFEG